MEQDDALAGRADDAVEQRSHDALDGRADDEGYRRGVTALLGLLAVGELLGFERLAADAASAPTLTDRAALQALAAQEQAHFAQLRARLAEIGGDIESAMGEFLPVFEEFHRRTSPSDWLEGLVKAYVGDAIARDFLREVSVAVGPSTRALVLAALEDAGQADYVVRRVRAAIEADPTVAGRLALWGRRLVGEALSQAQRVAGEHAELTDLLVGTPDRPGMDLGELGALFTRLTEAHTRRMAALGLSA
ncbi:tRNA-(MS[2]IO[6]A)-hydroxylase MiaE-like protein [Motilibacter rhizosphaerae]|uniref:tRNA-(MS[2]IO[6]A)-hydroxylase MiaE-like protein n=1 Tax=Motilibacter rhizosphaerae TaxID=598652 RepID=A0A4V2F4D4_9ACTN|nr:ferritin-like fold-containing protein [Motilibacter rhizosphaerae]RZS87217.1 tRNA-(MS[2]IO[6]A)-hydroxylase MiaE-like protein [Motilibacter rhizosphaerae]